MEQPGSEVQWVGSPCGSHGPYTFYKAFQCRLQGRARILCLGDFFPVRCRPAGCPPCIAELQLLWEERTSGQLLSSSKLYYLPEDTPHGRSSEHGQDEVIADSEKVILKLEELVTWAHSDFSKWKCGLQALPVKCKELGKNGKKQAFLKRKQSILNSGLNFKDVIKEKVHLGEDENEANMIVLSYPQYCRYRSMLKRIEAKSSSLLVDQFVLALGGIAVINKNTHIFYCRETFDHPGIVENESICEEFDLIVKNITQPMWLSTTNSPNLKGRPRKKKPFSQRRDSFNDVKDSSSHCDGKPVAKVKCEAKSPLPKPKSNNSNIKKSTEESPKVTKDEECRSEEQDFLATLYEYMKERKTPIERIPYLGFKQINLWTMFQAAQKLGGYETITARRQWKHVYDELGGNPGSTSAATCTRRHYERLILPYERSIKGEEDKPLPPVKPRKPDTSSAEVETKTKVSEAKPIKVDSKRIKRERDGLQTPQESSEVSLEQEKSQEAVEEESTISNIPALEEIRSTPAPEVTGLVAMEKVDLLEVNCNKEVLIEEAKELQQIHGSSDLVTSKEEPELDPTEEHLQAKTNDLSDTKQESVMQNSVDPIEKELQEAPLNIFPDIQEPVENRNDMEDEELAHLPDYIANCTVKMDPLGSEDLKSPMEGNLLKHALKQNTKVYVVQSLDVLKEKELHISVNDNPTFNYTPLLYSRGNPGIMSPLAKKKLLSQVSGSSQASSYPYGSPPPLISKKRSNDRDELSVSGLKTSQYASINRPSVIQHAQSFKTNNEEERTPINNFVKQSSSKLEVHRCDFLKHHQNSHADSAVKPDIHDCKDKIPRKRHGHHSRVTNFLADFYSSPHLHRLYKQTEHHLSSEQAGKHFSHHTFQDSGSISNFGKPKNPEKSNLRYHPPLHHQEKQPALESSTDEQPTDLSLPKAMNKQSKKLIVSNFPYTMAQQESKPISQFQVENSHTANSNSNARACRVLPMAMSAPRKNAEGSPRSGTSQIFRLDSLSRVEGTVHPMPSSKVQNIGKARPLKRSLDDLHNDVSEKKIRVVSPLCLPKETPGKEKLFNHGGEISKFVHDKHSDSMLERHKYSISSPMFPRLYPGSLCTGLSSRIPGSYSHPLQYLKNQTVYSPVMQPLTLQSFMMQRQFLGSSANSQQLYRHLAAGTPVGSSYGDLLHNNIYPLASINSQNMFPPSQLSSSHPSTKL